MKWKTFTIETTTEAEDLIADMLSDLGITGVQLEDNMQILDDDTMDLFEDVMPKQLPDDGTAKVTFFLEDGLKEEELLAGVRAGLDDIKNYVDIGSGKISSGETEDKDWINNWKEHFHAFYVDDILIKPTWVEKPEDDHSSFMIEIDPGTAFGTGSHETTQLCIRALKKYLKKDDVLLDVGTGSGILGIVSMKLGAKSAFGTDIDEMAVNTAKENIALNGVTEEQFSVMVGNIIDDPYTQDTAGYEKYDVVVANILADIIIPLQKEVVCHMKPNSLLIVSGIINLKEAAVEKALNENPNLEIIDKDYQGEWVSFVARKK